MRQAGVEQRLRLRTGGGDLAADSGHGRLQRVQRRRRRFLRLRRADRGEQLPALQAGIRGSSAHRAGDRGRIDERRPLRRAELRRQTGGEACSARCSKQMEFFHDVLPIVQNPEPSLEWGGETRKRNFISAAEPCMKRP